MSIRNWWKVQQSESISLDEVEIQWLGLKGRWVADRAQQEASWELYVELITRISVQPLRPDEGLLSEALSSIYSLFAETRRILKAHGPRVARPLPGGTLSLGKIAVEVLNVRLRPFLAKWHPLLQAYETNRPPSVSSLEHENAWPHAAKLRAEIEELRVQILEYAHLLARASAVEPLHPLARKQAPPAWE
jgi:hypothetical protein